MIYIYLIADCKIKMYGLLNLLHTIFYLEMFFMFVSLKHINSAILFISALLVCIFLSACENPSGTVYIESDMLSENVASEKNELLDISTFTGESKTLTFSFTIDDFSKNYNHIYRQIYNEDFFRIMDKWEIFNENTSPFYSKECNYYRFNREPTILTYPTISIYTDITNQYVYGLTIDFDDHGYSPSLYNAYEKQCFFSIKTLLPFIDDNNLMNMISDLNQSAYENVKIDALQSSTVPDILYLYESVGIFSYFAIGDYLHICIIPVDQTIIGNYSSSGTIIVQIN